MSSHSSVDFRPLIKTRGGGASKSAATFATIFAADDDTSVNVDSDTDESGLLNMRHSASGSSIALDMLPMPDWRQSVSKPLTYKMGNSTITFQRPLVAAIVVIVLALCLLVYATFGGGSRKSAGAKKFSGELHDDHFHPEEKAVRNRPYNSTYPLTQPTITPEGMRYRIGIISDLDEKSAVEGKSNLWASAFKRGYLTYDSLKKKVKLEWDEGDEIQLQSALATGGRGMELSELVIFNGKLYSVDDRTGVVYQIENGKVVPWVILSDGNGGETKGFKGEWCAVKDEHLYIGGLGKEWTTPDGNVINFNPMFVKRISTTGEVEHLDWHDNYLALRKKAGIEFPGYMIHEAVSWSEHQRKWYFLPRRASKFKYNDVEDERHGTNMLLESDADFRYVNLRTVGDLETPSHGFSTFKFVPQTGDRVIVALKSEELEGKVATYVMVFTVDGTILYPETKIGDRKYEGIEFI